MRRQISQTPTLIKILALLSVILFSSQIVLLACRCRCRSDNCDGSFKEKSPANKRSLNDAAHVENEASLSKVAELRKEIENLKQKLTRYEKVSAVLVSQDLSNSALKLDEDFDVFRGYTPRSEYDVIPFNSFDAGHLYGKAGTLSGNPVEGLSGQRGVEQNEVLQFAVKTINEDSESKGDPVSTFQLAEGIMRNDLIHGTVYDLYFRSAMQDIFKRIQVLRSFGPLQSFGKLETIVTSKTVINVIVPLSGRLGKFSSFMQRFIDVGIRWDQDVFLTIVYFGMDGRDKLRSIMKETEEKEKFKKYKIIFTTQEFSRGAGLQKGAEAWEGGNVLMFFCDVDIYFGAEFLERCRMHSSPGRKVYYPIVFSQYNPVITYGGEEIPSLEQQMRLSKDTGFWRDFGFGMSCQYRDDFFKVGGFDLTIKGWGMEDVKLYKNYLYSKLTVIRAYDRGIFHIYHKKKCQRNLSDEQFVSCLQSKAVSEGSHKQMGMLAFGQHIVGDTDPPWGKLLKFSLSAASAPQQMTKEEEAMIKRILDKEYELEKMNNQQERKGQAIESQLKIRDFGESLLTISKEFKILLDNLSQGKTELKVSRDFQRLKELQLVVLKTSQDILAQRRK